MRYFSCLPCLLSDFIVFFMSLNWEDFPTEFLREECVRRQIPVPTGAEKEDLLKLLECVPPPIFMVLAAAKGESSFIELDY